MKNQHFSWQPTLQESRGTAEKPSSNYVYLSMDTVTDTNIQIYLLFSSCHHLGRRQYNTLGSTLKSAQMFYFHHHHLKCSMES